MRLYLIHQPFEGTLIRGPLYLTIVFELISMSLLCRAQSVNLFSLHFQSYFGHWMTTAKYLPYNILPKHSWFCFVRPDIYCVVLKRIQAHTLKSKIIASEFLKASSQDEDDEPFTSSLNFMTKFFCLYAHNAHFSVLLAHFFCVN